MAPLEVTPDTGLATTGARVEPRSAPTRMGAAEARVEDAPTRMGGNRWDEAARGEPAALTLPATMPEAEQDLAATVAASSTRADARVTPTPSRTQSPAAEEETAMRSVALDL